MTTNVFLSGPPGVGKSTVGRALAARLGVAGLDLDRLVEEKTRRTPAAILRGEGEAELRSREAEALEALEGSAAVVALGGGTLTTARGRCSARSRGKVLGLWAEREVLRRRLAGDELDRPLLSGGPEALDALLTARRTSYAAVDRTIDADGPLDVVVERAANGASSLELVFAEVGRARSRIVLGRDLSEAARGAVASLMPSRPVLLVVDRGVPEVIRRRYVASITSLFPAHVVEVEGGERVKTWPFLGEVLDGALAAGCGRQGVVVGIGGGATCDLSALAANLLGRGAPLVLVPTTLLAQVDASIGGKAAVNMAAGRNLVGAFHPATDVVVDAVMLESLDARDYTSGLAELLKMAVIADAGLFDELVAQHPLRVSAAQVTRAVRHKAAVVARDPFERGERKLLNLGHTLGHALEVASDFAMSHGEAVAVGMAAVVRFSHRSGWLSAAGARRILDGLVAVGLPVSAPAELLQQSARFLGGDKKADATGLDLIAVHEVGKVSTKRVSSAELMELVRCGSQEGDVLELPSHVPWVGGNT